MAVSFNRSVGTPTSRPARPAAKAQAAAPTPVSAGDRLLCTRQPGREELTCEAAPAPAKTATWKKITLGVGTAGGAMMGFAATGAMPWFELGPFLAAVGLGAAGGFLLAGAGVLVISGVGKLIGLAK